MTPGQSFLKSGLVLYMSMSMLPGHCTFALKVGMSFHYDKKSLKVMLSLVNHEEGTSLDETKGILCERKENWRVFLLF